MNKVERLAPKTTRWYDECLRAFIDWLIEQDEEPTLASLSVDVVAEYVLHLQTRPNRHTGAPFSSNTVHAHVRVLKRSPATSTSVATPRRTCRSG